jgi:hypothetical protein
MTLIRVLLATKNTDTKFKLPYNNIYFLLANFNFYVYLMSQTLRDALVRILILITIFNF